MKLWFFTRSLYPYQKSGGAQMRNAQITYLKKLGYDVVVVTPLYEDSHNRDEDTALIQIEYKQDIRFCTLLEMIGIYEDYLDPWVKRAYKILKGQVQKEDIIFATSGGELGMIKLATRLKEKIGCKVVANFHDPLVYSKVNGYKYNYRFHVSRESVEKKYLQKIDMIITSTNIYKESLSKKYPHLSNNIFAVRFGYIQKSPLQIKECTGTIKIVYAGMMSETQSPEVALELLEVDKNIVLYYIGNINGYKLLENITDPRVKFIEYMPYEKLQLFLQKNVDIGFVSLKDDYFGACIPSKIYEYINLGLPILGALPKGDAQAIINDHNFGKAVDYSDSNALKTAYLSMKQCPKLNEIRKNVINKREEWSFQNQFSNIKELLEKLVLGDKY